MAAETKLKKRQIYRICLTPRAARRNHRRIISGLIIQIDANKGCRPQDSLSHDNTAVFRNLAIFDGWCNYVYHRAKSLSSARYVPGRQQDNLAPERTWALPDIPLAH
jgi:hypothetical protein